MLAHLIGALDALFLTQTLQTSVALLEMSDVSHVEDCFCSPPEVGSYAPCLEKVQQLKDKLSPFRLVLFKVLQTSGTAVWAGAINAFKAISVIAGKNLSPSTEDVAALSSHMVEFRGQSVPLEELARASNENKIAVDMMNRSIRLYTTSLQLVQDIDKGSVLVDLVFKTKQEPRRTGRAVPIRAISPCYSLFYSSVLVELVFAFAVQSLPGQAGHVHSSVLDS
jgi:hypothetical protein